jgi:hypothetical protein
MKPENLIKNSAGVMLECYDPKSADLAYFPQTKQTALDLLSTGDYWVTVAGSVAILKRVKG